MRVDLKVGFACNNRCVFCAQGRKREDAAALPMDDLVRLLREGRARGDRLVLTGGEPTIRRDLPDLVAAARRLGYRHVQIQTNARMLAYQSLCDALIAAGATEFAPSLHGHVAELHDALVGAPGAFLHTVAGIRNAVSSSVPVLSNTVIVRANLPHLGAIVSLLADLGVTQMQLAWAHPVGTAAERFDEVVAPPSELAPHLHDALDHARARRVPCLTEAVPYCLLRGHEQAAAETHIPHTVVFDLGRVVDFEAYRRGEGKVHGPPCETCTWRDRCEGMWREIPARFGWDAIEPRRDAVV